MTLGTAPLLASRPDSAISGALNFERPPFHCYGRGAPGVHSLPGGEMASNISLRQGCARDRKTHNVKVRPQLLSLNL